VHPTRHPESGEILTVETAPVPHPWHYFRDLLLGTGGLVPIQDYNPDYLSISTADVLARIKAGDPSWESLVPLVVAETIKAGGLFRAAPRAGGAAVAG
jgi:hypothetical protein